MLIRVYVEGRELDVEMDLDWVVAAGLKRPRPNAVKVAFEATDQKTRRVQHSIRAISNTHLVSADAATERRCHVRFPLQLRCRYESLGRGQLLAGEGWVKNMSVGGVLISGKSEMTLGTRIQLAIDWPCLLHGRTPLQIVSAGRLVRCEISGFAVAVARYQFRTRKKPGSIDTVYAGNV